jgi:hypothetical protein
MEEDVLRTPVVVLALALLIVVGPAHVLAATEVVDQELQPSTALHLRIAGDTQPLFGQTFTPSVAGQTTRVEVYVSAFYDARVQFDWAPGRAQQGIPATCAITGYPGPLTLQLRAVDTNGTPVAGVLASGTVNASSIAAADAAPLPTVNLPNAAGTVSVTPRFVTGWQSISLGAPVTLTPGTKYAFTLTQGADGAFGGLDCINAFELLGITTRVLAPLQNEIGSVLGGPGYFAIPGAGYAGGGLLSDGFDPNLDLAFRTFVLPPDIGDGGNGGGDQGGGGPVNPGATPELDSVVLFGSGIFGLGSYAVLRLRARRRRAD